MKHPNCLDRSKVTRHTEDVRRDMKPLSVMGSPALNGGCCAAQPTARDVRAGGSTALVGETPIGLQVSSGTGRTLWDVVASGNDVHSLGNSTPKRGRFFPYVFVSKRCTSCGQFKKLWHFYRVKDWSASDKRYWYPSARCKPCHNTLRVENRRERKAREVAR